MAVDALKSTEALQSSRKPTENERDGSLYHSCQCHGFSLLLASPVPEAQAQSLFGRVICSYPDRFLEHFPLRERAKCWLRRPTPLEHVVIWRSLCSFFALKNSANENVEAYSITWSSRKVEHIMPVHRKCNCWCNRGVPPQQSPRRPEAWRPQPADVLRCRPPPTPPHPTIVPDLPRGDSERPRGHQGRQANSSSNQSCTQHGPRQPGLRGGRRETARGREKREEDEQSLFDVPQTKKRLRFVSLVPLPQFPLGLVNASCIAGPVSRWPSVRVGYRESHEAASR